MSASVRHMDQYLCHLFPIGGSLQELTCWFSIPLGTGAVYSFDPVGSYEREACRAAGAAQSLVQPFLDNQVSYKLFIDMNKNEPDVVREPLIPVPNAISSSPILCRFRTASLAFRVQYLNSSCGLLLTSAIPFNNRYTSRIRLLHREHHSPNISRCRLFYPSWSTHSPVLLNDTSRFVSVFHIIPRSRAHYVIIGCLFPQTLWPHSHRVLILHPDSPHFYWFILIIFWPHWYRVPLCWPRNFFSQK